MALKRKKPKGPTTIVLGATNMMTALLDDLVRRGVITAGDTHVPLAREMTADLQDDEVVVFRDLFAASLRFPLDPMVVESFQLFNVFLHQMTPNSIVRMRMYMWLAKSCELVPSTEGSAYTHWVHYQPKRILLQAGGREDRSCAPIRVLHLRVTQDVAEPRHRIQE
jgi:hypothetical protein